MVKRLLAAAILLTAALATSGCSLSSLGTDGSADAEPTPVEVPFTCNDGYRFGDTARVEAGHSYHAVADVVATAPQEFTPSDLSEATQAFNIFFEVTLTNVGDEAWEPTIFTEVESAGVDGDQIFLGGIRSTGWDEIPPGGTFTFRDQWSVADPTDILYSLDIDGLAGPTICFVD